MASFKYELITKEGKRKKGTIDAADEEAARKDLKRDGATIISLASANVLEKDIEIHIGKIVKPREMSVFCRQFQSVLKAGVTVIEALDMLAEQTENKAFRKAIAESRDSVKKGETLAESMAQHPKVFPEIMIHMVAAGEASGGLDIAFDRLASYFEKSSKISGLIVKSMIYPIVLICVIVVIVIIMMVKIVPTFTSTFNDLGAGELPGITKAVMAVSDAFVNNWYIMLAVILLVVFFIKGFKSTERGAILFGKLGLSFPLVGNLTIKNASAQFARTLSTLMASGISVVDGIGIVEKILKNQIVKQVLKRAQKKVTEGVALSIPLEESGVFPPMVYHMIRIGEDTGNMEEMLEKIADYYDEEVEMATASLLAALEPLIIILMAVIVVPIVLAIMLPMYSIYDAVGAA